MTDIKRFLIYIFLALYSFFLFSCFGTTHYTLPTGYDLNHPVKVELESNLDEISGLAYYAKDTSVFAISDATGSLYKIFPDRNTFVQKWKFGGNHDYEDVVLQDSIFYVLSSSGDLVRIHFTLPDSMHVDNYKFPVDGNNEFETLYYDSAKAQLILVCKDCKVDEKNYVGTWAFDPATQTYTQGFYKINYKDITDYLKDGEKKRLKPSAAAVNPLTHQLYILASVNNLLVVANKNGIIQKVYPLDPGIYRQPEGITFTPAGDLLISNESTKGESADILIIKFKKSSSK